jgi:hypothetical protein
MSPRALLLVAAAAVMAAAAGRGALAQSSPPSPPAPYAQDGSPISISLTLDGDQVTGEWSMSNDGSKITGKKLPPS